MKNKTIITRENNKIEIIPFKFSGMINGYFVKINGKEYKENGEIKTFKTIKEINTQEIERRNKNGKKILCN